MDDIERFLEKAAQRYPQKPLFLYGHSLGGLLALNYILRRQPDLAGAITSGAGLRTSLTEQTGKVAMVNLLGRFLPGLSISTGLDARTISRDPCIVETYLADPWSTIVPPWEWPEPPGNHSWVMEHARNKIAHPADERNSRPAHVPAGSQISLNGSGDCRVLWPDCITNHNEPEKEQVLEHMLEWLKTGCEMEPAPGCPGQNPSSWHNSARIVNP
jgi:pimeloyl-ACP methyl ester carboxylesterase